MFTCELIKEKIEKHINGANAIITDPRNDNEHFMATIIWQGFKDMSLIEQHRMVYDALKEEMSNGLHSLSIKTKTE